MSSKKKSVSFCKREETFKEEKVSKSFDKDRADVLAASEVDFTRRGRTKSMGERDC